MGEIISMMAKKAWLMTWMFEMIMITLKKGDVLPCLDRSRPCVPINMCRQAKEISFLNLYNPHKYELVLNELLQPEQALVVLTRPNLLPLSALWPW